MLRPGLPAVGWTGLGDGSAVARRPGGRGARIGRVGGPRSHGSAGARRGGAGPGCLGRCRGEAAGRVAAPAPQAGRWRVERRRAAAQGHAAGGCRGALRPTGVRPRGGRSSRRRPPGADRRQGPGGGGRPGGATAAPRRRPGVGLDDAAARGRRGRRTRGLRLLQDDPPRRAAPRPGAIPRAPVRRAPALARTRRVRARDAAGNGARAGSRHGPGRPLGDRRRHRRGVQGLRDLPRAGALGRSGRAAGGARLVPAATAAGESVDLRGRDDARDLQLRGLRGRRRADRARRAHGGGRDARPRARAGRGCRQPARPGGCRAAFGPAVECRRRRLPALLRRDPRHPGTRRPAHAGHAAAAAAPRPRGRGFGSGAVRPGAALGAALPPHRAGGDPAERGGGAALGGGAARGLRRAGARAVRGRQRRGRVGVARGARAAPVGRPRARRGLARRAGRGAAPGRARAPRRGRRVGAARPPAAAASPRSPRATRRSRWVRSSPGPTAGCSSR